MSKLSNDQVRRMRELKSLGASKQQLCLEFKVSGGHLDRILNGTARLEAGGPITNGMVLEDQRKDIEKLNSMTDEERTLFIRQGSEAAGFRMPEAIPDPRPSEAAQRFGARTKERLIAERFGQFEKLAGKEVVMTPAGIPIDLETLRMYGEQNESRPPDPNELLDELMKK